MATVVKRNDVLEPRPDILYPRDLGEKGRKLPDPLFERVHPFQGFWFFLEQLGKMMRHHRRTGSRGNHDGFARLEGFQEMPRNRSGLGAVAAVECRLPAASLIF